MTPSGMPVADAERARPGVSGEQGYSTRLPRNLDELEAQETEGVEFHPSVFVNVVREHQIVVAAIHYTGQVMGAGIESRHLHCSDYKVIWRSIESLHRKMSAAIAAGQSDVPTKVVAEDLLAEAILCDSERFGTPFGRRFIAKICRDEPVSLYRAVQLIPEELRSRVELDLLATKMQQWSKEIPETSSPLELHQMLAVHARELTRSVNQGVQVEDPVHVARRWPSFQKTQKAIRTGFIEIDGPTGGGLGRGELMVIGGGTGHGKSYFATALMRRQAGRTNGAKILYISLEDPTELVLCRMMSQFTEPAVSPVQIRQKLHGESTVSDDVMNTAVDKMQRELEGRIEIVTAPKWSLARILSLIRTRRHVGGIDMVIVDYLQAITADDADSPRAVNRTQATSTAVSQLKAVAHEVGVGMVLLSQYSRDDYRDGAEPSVNACKYAGDIENESEIMVLLWRDSAHQLYAKLGKLKWASAMGHKYTVQTNQVTGELLDWVRYIPSEDDEDGAPKKRKPWGGRS